jgi:hypothetical protein
MFIEKSMMEYEDNALELADDIQVLKLSSGETIVTRVLEYTSVDENGNETDEDEEPVMIVLDPLLITSVQNGDSSMYSIFSRWNPFAKDNISFVSPYHIIASSNCSDEVAIRYNEILISMHKDSTEDFDEQKRIEKSNKKGKILH